MIADLHMFVASLLHRRGIDDRDTYALRSAHALSNVRNWKQPTIKLALGAVRTDLYHRNRFLSRDEVLDLVSSALAKNWSANPVAVAESSLPPAIKVLFVAANPVHIAAYEPVTGAPLVNMPLGLDHEFREIQSKIRGSKYRESIELAFRTAAQAGDLLQALHEVQPDVVHLSGHGSRAEGLYLLDRVGRAKPVSGIAIASLFKLVKDHVRLVVFNACESRPLAAAVTKHIDCAIGTSKAIGDEAAIAFGAALYRALGFGQSVKRAFEEGLVELQLQGIDEDKTPKLVTRKGVVAKEIQLVLKGSDA